ncbi:PML-RARA-regulated adapter molecule 1 [Camelus ferus]|nr:PML-RARA-regulated adapter molecule 1 [Camelus ferus]
MVSLNSNLVTGSQGEQQGLPVGAKGSHQDFRSLQAKFQASQPETSELPKKTPKPEFNKLKKFPQPGLSEHPKKPPQPEVTDLPKKPSKLELSELSRKAPQLEATRFPRKPSQPEVGEAPPTASQPEPSAPDQKPPQSELGNTPRPSVEPKFSAHAKKFQQPEASPSFSALPKKPPQPEFSANLRKPPQPRVGGFPKKSLPQSNFSELNDLPKLLQPEYGDLPRTSSEPEVNVTSSEPEFNLLSPKFPQPEFRGPPRKFSQPEPMAGSGARFLLGPGLGARQQKLGALTRTKPPRPPSPRDIQSFWRISATDTALPRASSSAGIHVQARQLADIPQDADEVYELYDDVEPTDDSSPSPRGRDEVPSPQQPPRRPPQDPELRKEKALQPQQLMPTDLKTLKQIRKAEKAEREFRKKFKFEGEIVIQTRMMIDPNAKTRRGGGKHLGIRRGEILEVIEFTNKEEMLCRDTKGKYGYVPRTALLPLETEVYDDVSFWGM